MSLNSLQRAIWHACRTLPQLPSFPGAVAPAPLQGQPQPLSSLLSLLSPFKGFATVAAAPDNAEQPLHPSAAMHIRRQREKPQNSGRNVFHRAEKKKLQIRANARNRKKQEKAALAERDAARLAKWRAGAALWKSGQAAVAEQPH